MLSCKEGLTIDVVDMMIQKASFAPLQSAKITIKMQSSTYYWHLGICGINEEMHMLEFWKVSIWCSWEYFGNLSAISLNYYVISYSNHSFTSQKSPFWLVHGNMLLAFYELKCREYNISPGIQHQFSYISQWKKYFNAGRTSFKISIQNWHHALNQIGKTRSTWHPSSF